MCGWKALVFLVGWSACYDAPTGNEPCTITCIDACPGDLSCQNGFCVGDGEQCAPGFEALSMGAGFACSIDELSDLWCWGHNDHHQIDPGTELVVTVARRVDTDRKYKQVSTGRAHVCAIAESGELFCWGANDRNQITVGVRGDIEQPTKIEFTGGPEAWRSVSAGFQSTCAIADDGRLFCWGRNDFGQLGIGNTMDVGTPVPVASELTDWKFVALGGGQRFGQHACGVSESAGLLCWGSNTYGQLGDPVVTQSVVPLEIAGLGNVTALGLAAYSSCAVSDGDLYCFGYNVYGSLGDPTVIVPDGGILSTPTLASNLRGGWTELGAAEIVGCGLFEDEVYCWGNTRNGNGVGGGAWLPGLQSFTKVADGAQHVAVGFNESIDSFDDVMIDLENGCFIGAGAIRCWGDNRFGQLGQGATAETAVPLEIAGGTTWTQLATGSRHACGIDAGGQASCWGSTLASAVDGTLGGTVDQPCDRFPCDIGTPQLVQAAESVAIGTDHTCALAGGTITCWGDNSFNQHGMSVTTTAPSTVPGTFSAMFDLHGNATCGRSASDVTCWGNASDPLPIAELAAMTSIANAGIIGGGFGVGCFLDTTNTLFCSGDNSLGQYGNGPLCAAGSCPTCGNLACDNGETTASCPGDCGSGSFSKLRSYSAFSLGWDVDNEGAPICGVTAGGTVECWGRNPGGMISQEIDINTGRPIRYALQPVPIANLASCTQVSVGRRHACALCNNDILCWGDHEHGAVGSGPQTFVPVLEPRPIGVVLDAGDSWAQLTSGVGFSCALSKAGRGYCWGGNQHGALGLGAAASTIPVLVRTE